MLIPKCKYLRASGERVLENIFRLGSTCSVSSWGMWACNWSCCSFLYINVYEVTGHVASHIAGQQLHCWLHCQSPVAGCQSHCWLCCWLPVAGHQLHCWSPVPTFLTTVQWSCWDLRSFGSCTGLSLSLQLMWNIATMSSTCVALIRFILICVINWFRKFFQFFFWNLQ